MHSFNLITKIKDIIKLFTKSEGNNIEMLDAIFHEDVDSNEANMTIAHKEISFALKILSYVCIDLFSTLYALS